ncbi:FecR family protein [Psychroserpens sp. MEBiC05023]
MEKDITNGSIIRKWLEGELSEQEISALKTSDTYKDYKKIIDAADALNVPTYDIDQEYIKIQSLKQQKSKPVVKLKHWMYTAAAILVLAFGYFYLVNDTAKYHTAYGEQLTVTLPDNSKILLNANSSIEFDEPNWDKKREVSLSGEGFFEVEKGSKFTVKTNQGLVEVLGTKFNVLVQSNVFEVTCLEGKVKASDTKGKSTILTRGMGYRNIIGETEAWNFTETHPSWTQGESSFVNAPLHQVLITFQNQYNVTFENKNVDENQRFTGSFTHDNFNTALKTLFDAMEISYTFEEEQKIVLFKSE